MHHMQKATFVLMTLIILLNITNSLHIEQIHIDLYHNSTQLQSQIRSFKPKNVNSTPSYRQCTKQNTTYELIQIGGTDAKYSALITCNVHARELIASQACVLFIKQLVESNDPSTKKLRELIHFRIFYIGNEMRDSVLSGDYCKRTDQNDVDINRNFPTGYIGSELGSQTNGGPSALSEPFSQCVEQEVDRNKPDIFLDVHTGEFSIYYQDDEKLGKEIRLGKIKVMEMGKRKEMEMKVLYNIVNKVCRNCRLRDNSLDSNGIIFSDIKLRKHVQWSNLIQIYGGYNSNLNQQDYCMIMFNPNSKRSFNYYLKRGKDMIMEYFLGIVEVENEGK